MYDKMSPKAQNGAILGNKIRRINGILCNAKGTIANDVEVFTLEELSTIERICANAKVRAQTVFDKTKARLETNPSGRSKTEHRQYNGK